MKAIIFIFIGLVGQVLMAQVPAPIAQQYNRILIQNGRVHTGLGKIIPRGVVGIEEGKIILVANALTYKMESSSWDTIINIQGQELYPGFIAANNTIGLTEIDAVRATNDYREVGYISPHVRSLIAFNLDSKIIYTIRTNGVLICQATPRGGLISGTSSVFGLDGWHWEDAVILKDDGIHVNWPSRFYQTGWWAAPGLLKENDKYATVIESLTAFFKESQAYLSEKDQEQISIKHAAMRNVLMGNGRIYFHADFAPEINDVIDFAKVFKIKYPVIVGGHDASFLADRLKENDFTIMLSKPHHLPYFEGDQPYDNYQTAKLLQDAGLLFCIQNAGSMEVMNARNLPFLAGTAMAYGLTEEQAVACISYNAAKILGVDHLVGSIADGKVATLFVSKGNALDMRTNNVSLGMINGRFIALENHQMALSKKYHQKYQLTD
ncbi:amidohydrolase [Putridiphycobacter roseus]|uniref:Amidohydrolase n=1 Tax=Putridiphycobacter roseus TaxID=2219161 RepID=A0A2W1NJL8_9FLAO|nr:amidohydrolase family protein [Putridiphycobacter roseus]PZE15812.1 amidohydrolase [Putridiphycobacter roseus]